MIMSDLWPLCGHQLCKAARTWSPAMQSQNIPGHGRAAAEILVTAVACGKCEDLNSSLRTRREPRTGACTGTPGPSPVTATSRAACCRLCRAAAERAPGGCSGGGRGDLVHEVGEAGQDVGG